MSVTPLYCHPPHRRRAPIGFLLAGGHLLAGSYLLPCSEARGQGGVSDAA
jgi:hypothetical protein